MVNTPQYSQDNFSNFMNELQNISAKGNFQPAAKLNPVKPQQINLSTPNLIAPSGGGVPNSSGGSSSLDQLMSAIKKQESGGNYGATNPSGASGAYQILASNFSGAGGWDKQALGKDISYSQFMNSPQDQDAIARYMLGKYQSQYGNAGAAVAWYGGPGAVSHMYDKSPQAGGYPSLYAYWTSVLNKM